MPSDNLTFIKIPQHIVNDLKNNIGETLKTWLTENQIKYLDCKYVFSFHPKAAILASKVIGVSAVEALDFSGNNLRDDGPQVASNLTGEDSQLHTLNLAVNMLGKDGPQTAANLTSEHTKLQTLNMGSNHLEEYGPQVAFNLTALKQSKLHTLNLSNNNLKYGPLMARYLTNPYYSKLHTLNLRGNTFGFLAPETADILANPDSRLCTVELDYPFSPEQTTIFTLNDITKSTDEYKPNTLQTLCMTKLLKSLKGKPDIDYYHAFKSVNTNLRPELVLLQARAITLSEFCLKLRATEIIEARETRNTPLSPLLLAIKNVNADNLNPAVPQPVLFGGPSDNNKRKRDEDDSHGPTPKRPNL